jgi:hypothetical protein
MQTRDTIEDLVTHELAKLCITCVHANRCIYQNTATSASVKCALVDQRHDQIDYSKPSRGLCSMCDHANHCSLPGRQEGVWRCNEFL